MGEGWSEGGMKGRMERVRDEGKDGERGMKGVKGLTHQMDSPSLLFKGNLPKRRLHRPEPNRTERESWQALTD